MRDTSSQGLHIPTGVGSGDVYLVKTDSLGDTLWTKTYGGNYPDYGLSVIRTPDGGYIITGATLSYGAGSWDVYLLKIDSLGNTLWTKTYGGGEGDEGWFLSPTSDGGFIITGYTESYGAGHADVYLIKTDSLGNVSGVREPDNYILPRTFILSQNYPNPFNSSTEISYTLPKDSQAKIEIYNILGRKVATLVDGKQKAGIRSVRWNAQELGSGIYLCRLKAGEYSKTMKTILLK